MSARLFPTAPKGLIRRVVARAVRMGLRRLGGSYYCVCCGKNSSRFLPYGGGWRGAPDVVVHLDIVGSDLDNYECPKCGASDRERHLQLYCMHAELKGGMTGARILHFAPERHFSRFVQSSKPAQYVKADLYPTSSDILRVDMLNTPFEDGSFDMVIANHVLEHVENDIAALREIRRILRPEGLAILQTPYSAVLAATLEDRGVVSDLQREFLYGQADHVRLYGGSIFEVFASAGFMPCVLRHQDTLNAIDATIHGVNVREPLFLFKRM